MARIGRVVLPGHPHHVTQRGVRSMDIFYKESDYLAYLDLLKEQGRRFTSRVRR
jgi:putative transposase